MYEKKLRISIRDDLVDRDMPSISKSGRGWQNVELTVNQLIDHIQRGHPITHQFVDGHRVKEKFLRTDILIADIDKGIRIDEALENDFVKNFAAFIHTTPSHTDDAHRFRIVFVLERAVFDPNVYEAMYRSMLGYIPTDPNAKSSTQFFFGAKKSKVYRLNRVMTEDQMNKMAADGVQKTLDQTETPIHEMLTLDTLIKVKNRGLHPLRSLSENASVHCPFQTHEDKNPSAFVLINKHGVYGVQCRSCGHKEWVEKLPVKDNFSYFEKMVTEYAGRENSNFSYQGLAEYDHDLETSMGKSNFHISNSKHLLIKDLVPGIHLIRSAKGTGKTEAMSRIVEVFKNPKTRKKLGLEQKKPGRTILIGHRQTLIRESSQKLGLECYLDTGDFDTKIQTFGKWINGDFKVVSIETIKPQHYAICLDSLHSRIRVRYEKYDVVIIDESEQVFSHFLSEHMKHPTSNFQILSHLIKNAKYVFCLDADLDRITMTGVISCLSYTKNPASDVKLGMDRRLQTLYCHLNAYVPLTRDIEVYTSKNQLEDDLRRSVSAGKRCFVTSNSKKFVEGLYQSFSTVYQDKKFELVVSDRGDDQHIKRFLRNIKDEFLNLDVLFASPSIGTGIDITFPDHKEEIDVVYGFFESNVNTHLDIDQQLGRVRHPKQVRVWINPKRHRFSTDINRIRKELLFGIDVQGLRFYLDQNGTHASEGEHPFMDVLSTVISVRRSSMNNLRSNFIDHKKRTGWNVVEVELNKQLALKGSVIDKASKVSRRTAYKERLIAAPDLSWRDIQKLDSSTQKNAPLTDEQKAGREKYWIKNFYAGDVTDELLEYDEEGKTREKIRLLEHLIDPAIKHTSHKQISDRADLLVGSNIKIDDLKKVVFLREVFDLAGIFDLRTFSFAPDAIYGTHTLHDMVKFLKSHRERYALVFEKELNDHLDERPANQLNSLLKIVGLNHVSVTKNKGKSKSSVATFKIDPSTYAKVIDIVKKRQKSRSKMT